MQINPASPGVPMAQGALERLLAAMRASVSPADVITATPDPTHPAPPPLDRLAGRQFSAVVLERIDAGRGRIEVAGLAMHVLARLPAAGSQVVLRVVDAEAQPRPAPATPVFVGALAQVLSALAAAPSKPVQLGPLPMSEPAQWARALVQRISESGLFYESHLARWSQGGFSLDALRREPQAGGPPATTTVATGPAPAGAARAETGMASTPAEPQARATGEVAALARDASAPALLREQLDTLEHRALNLAFDPWPGQAARLTIEGDDETARQGSETDAPPWTSTLTLALPRLGQVHARLTLAGRRLHLSIDVDAAGESRMLAHGGDLGSALEGAGITLARLSYLRCVRFKSTAPA